MNELNETLHSLGLPGSCSSSLSPTHMCACGLELAQPACLSGSGLGGRGYLRWTLPIPKDLVGLPRAVTTVPQHHHHCYKSENCSSRAQRELACSFPQLHDYSSFMGW